ncbi:MAG: vWA domain-containing protein [Nannocystaceae bacterium]
MDTNAAAQNDRTRLSLWKKWPLTTVSVVGGLVSMAVLLATSPAGELERDEELAALEEPAAADAEVDAPADAEPDAAREFEEEAPPPSEATDDAAATASVHRGEEGTMGKPTSKSKSGLYAMKGPKSAVPTMARDFDSPYGGAFALGHDDGDVWGGLAGTEVGEAYGAGGLGLVGTGRGGGGKGYGRGSGAGFGEGALGGRAEREKAEYREDGRYDRAIQARQLTAGVVDDNADPAGYAKALEKLDRARAPLGIDDSLWTMAPPQRRHSDNPRGLDVALVIDTTGSMGDELEYLKVEIRAIAEEIHAAYPNVDQRWGLVVYRDQGDAYVTRSVDFTDIDAFVDRLGKQSAGGGGDMPEAMDQAMVASSELSWRASDDTARMVFLVADAPSHAGAAARRYTDAVLQHRAAKTAIYPVAGSGVDAGAEAELRLAAKVTGGQYIFLTDHSGVGGGHKKAEVEQFKVESLHDAMARMIRGELRSAADDAAPSCEDPAPALELTKTPTVHAKIVRAAESAPAERDLWQMILERLAAHLLFASSMAVLMLAAIGADSLLRRRRENS